MFVCGGGWAIEQSPRLPSLERIVSNGAQTARWNQSWRRCPVGARKSLTRQRRPTERIGSRPQENFIKKIHTPAVEDRRQEPKPMLSLFEGFGLDDNLTLYNQLTFD
ncbi:MAG: hypothetical protein Q9214_005437 [Letrouitia sp. 1 TL-2023]